MNKAEIHAIVNQVRKGTFHISALDDLMKKLEADIRDETNKLSGKANIAKGMKAVIKSAQVLPNEQLHGAFMCNGMQCVSDGFRVIRLNTPIALPLAPVEFTADMNQWFKEPMTNSVEVQMPSLGELKGWLAPKQAECRKLPRAQQTARFEWEVETMPGYNADTPTPRVDAEYLFDILTVFPEARAFITGRNAWSTVYFKTDEGDALLLPRTSKKP